MKYIAATDALYSEHPSGGAKVAWDTALEIKKRGHDVTLVVLSKTHGEDDLREEHGIQILRVYPPHYSSWNPLRIHLTIHAVEKAVRQFLSHQTWDVVHLHMIRVGLGVLKGLNRPSRVISCVHSLTKLEYQNAHVAPKHFLAKAKASVIMRVLNQLERDMLNASDDIIVLSDFTKRSLAQHHGIKKNIHKIPFWTPPECQRTHTKEEARKLLGWPLSEKILFTVRAHIPRTGIDLGIKAVAPFAKKEQCLFYIGGSGSHQSVYKELVKELGVEDRMLFTGRLSDQDLALAYQAADLFILPTRALEGFGIIILEAYAYGCPVLSFDSSAIPESIRPISPDFLVPSLDVSSMQEKIKQFLNDTLTPPSPEELIAYTQTTFSPERLLPQILSTLEGAALGQSSPS